MTDRAEEYDESVTCSVCLDVFKTPKVLPCGHSFCLEPCLRDLAASNTKHRKMHCPLCRSRINLPKSRNPRDFPTNFSLQSILESKRRKRSPSSIDPDPHDDEAKKPRTAPGPFVQCTHLQEAQFYCETCEHFLCIECAEQYHKDHLHCIIAKDTAMERARSRSEDMVRDTLAALEQRLATLGGVLEQAKVSSIAYNMQVMDLKHEVREQMSVARKAIDKREMEYAQVIRQQAQADEKLFERFKQKWEGTRVSDQQRLKTLQGILVKVQGGDLTSMGEVMNGPPIDASCSAMVEEKRTLLPRGPPFQINNTFPDHLPTLQRVAQQRI